MSNLDEEYKCWNFTEETTQKESTLTIAGKTNGRGLVEVSLVLWVGDADPIMVPIDIIWSAEEWLAQVVGLPTLRHEKPGEKNE
jgi:hypothetical protein